MTLRYARGDRAWGMCARSNRRMLLKDMVRDPLTDLLVDPDWAEPPLPRPPTDIVDGVALENPAPDLDRIGTQVIVGTLFNMATGDILRPLVAKYETSPPVITATLRYLATEDGIFIIDENGQPIALEQYLVTEGGEFLTDENGNVIQL